MTLKRRTILKHAGMTAAVIAFGRAGQAQSAVTRRPSVYGPVGLEIEGAFAGWVDSYIGGDFVADVVLEAAGPTGVRKKHVANVAVRDIVLGVGNWMGSAFYQWIRDTLARGTATRNGAILSFDSQLRPIGRLEFGFATLKEVTFPALDASSREAARFTVRIATEQARMVMATAAAPGLPAKNRSPALVSNFRVDVENVDTSNVSAIEALTLTQTITTDLRGNVVSTELTEPDLALIQPGVGTFGPWADDFLVQGNRLDGNEKSGSLTLLGPNLMDTLFTLSFSHLGIVGVGPAAAEKGGAPMETRVQMYMEDMQFDFRPTW
jgi:hypothetical protein